MKKAIIVGASSGIGEELARVLANDGYSLGLVARRTELLKKIQDELPTKSYVSTIDVTDSNASDKLYELIDIMNGVDLVIISAGTGYLNNTLDFEKEKSTIDVNVVGATSMINVSVKHFIKQQYGHLVVISSIACLRGNYEAPAYNASKAFLSNYIEGIRIKLYKQYKNIYVTDIRPGLVDTNMAQGDNLFWVQPPDKVANQIYKSIKRKKKVVYVTKRWKVIALIMKYMPDWIYYKL